MPRRIVPHATGSLAPSQQRRLIGTRATPPQLSSAPAASGRVLKKVAMQRYRSTTRLMRVADEHRLLTGDKVLVVIRSSASATVHSFCSNEALLNSVRDGTIEVETTLANVLPSSLVPPTTQAAPDAASSASSSSAAGSTAIDNDVGPDNELRPASDA